MFTSYSNGLTFLLWKTKSRAKARQFYVYKETNSCLITKKNSFFRKRFSQLITLVLPELLRISILKDTFLGNQTLVGTIYRRRVSSTVVLNWSNFGQSKNDAAKSEKKRYCFYHFLGKLNRNSTVLVSWKQTSGNRYVTSRNSCKIGLQQWAAKIHQQFKRFKAGFVLHAVIWKIAMARSRKGL